mmetsp:Transcript_59087/g.163224  ORF Transcript_59087/g.163224 Transcript_59087/m.163224 type:complete len:239 (-) Transcript_59087:15-731(-)
MARLGVWGCGVTSSPHRSPPLPPRRRPHPLPWPAWSDCRASRRPTCTLLLPPPLPCRRGPHAPRDPTLSRRSVLHGRWRCAMGQPPLSCPLQAQSSAFWRAALTTRASSTAPRASCRPGRRRLARVRTDASGWCWASAKATPRRARRRAKRTSSRRARSAGRSGRLRRSLLLRPHHRRRRSATWRSSTTGRRRPSMCSRSPSRSPRSGTPPTAAKCVCGWLSRVRALAAVGALLLLAI